MTGVVAVVHQGVVTSLQGILAAEAEEEEGHSEVVEQEAEHALMPPRDELIWGTIAFVVVAGLLLWKGLPAAKKMAADRTARIAAELAAAKAARADAELAAATVTRQLADIDAEVARVVAEARTSADALRTEQLARLGDEVADLRTRATSDVDSSKERAVQELHAELAVLAVSAAEQVVRRSLDDTTRTALVDQFIDGLAANQGASA